MNDPVFPRYLAWACLIGAIAGGAFAAAAGAWVILGAAVILTGFWIIEIRGLPR